MPQPYSFSWIREPILAALGRPESSEALEWLREQGIEVLISLTEDPPRRDWINRAGLMLVHEPIVDMEAPTQEQLERCVSSIVRAHESNLGVAIHCGAGLGRTGTIAAAYLVHVSTPAREAINQIRELRPGSIETNDQEQAIIEFARRRKNSKSE